MGGSLGLAVLTTLAATLLRPEQEQGQEPNQKQPEHKHRVPATVRTTR
ncbi:hypothetical protein ACFQ0X_09980 [Streptomyces rectiviolaceus]